MRETATPRWLPAGVVAGLILTSALADRTKAAPAIWGEIGLPGGVASARVVGELGKPAGRMDAGFLLDFARKYAGVNAGSTVERMTRYLRAVVEMRSSLGGWPDGFVLPTDATPRAERDRVEATLGSLGLGLRRRGSAYETYERDGDDDRQRLAWVKGLGADPRAIVANLNSGRRVKVPVSESMLPLPLPEFWRTDVFEPDRLPLESILEDRTAWLTYHGLMALDEETLTYLSGQLRLLRRLREVSPVFAAFGRSVVVRGGELQLPGGPEARPVWEELVDRRVAQSDQFIAELLMRDSGRVAHFYDVVSHLGASRQRAVLGTHLTGESRVEFVTRVYECFRSVNPNWKLDLQPFNRQGFDAAKVLLALDARPDGSVGPAWWPSLLERVTRNADWPKRPDDTMKILRDQPADMVWALEWIFDSPSHAEARFQLLRFAQRMVPNAARETAPAVEVMLRAFADMPALALALERMGVTDASTFSVVARSAHALTAAGGPDAVVPVLSRWQAALGLLEQIQRRVQLSSPDLSRLLASLSAATPPRLDRPAGATAAWTIEHLLPAFLPGDTLEGDIERRALTAFTASPWSRTGPFLWEGLHYVADPGGVVLKDALGIRAARRGPALQDLIAVYRLARLLEPGPKTLDDVRGAEAHFARLAPVVALLPRVNGEPHPIVASFREAAKHLQDIKTLGDVAKASREVPVVLAAVDALTDAVVPALLYSLAISPTTQPAIYADTWSLHRVFEAPEVATARAPTTWRQVAWQVPRLGTGNGRGTGLVGAYLSVDIALAESQLARLPSEDEPLDQTLDYRDRLTAAQGLVVSGLEGLMDDARGAAVVAALKSGREIVAGWHRQALTPAQLAAQLRAAGVDEWTTNLMVWTHASGGAEPFAALRPSDLFRLGSPSEPPTAWAGSSARIDGCHCRLAADRRSLEDQRGLSLGVQSVGPQDLSLRLTEVLHSMGLGAALVPSLLPVAMQDWLDHAQPAWIDDWEASAAWPRSLPKGRVDEYLLFLTSRGVLAAAEGAVPGGER